MMDGGWARGLAAVDMDCGVLGLPLDALGSTDA